MTHRFEVEDARRDDILIRAGFCGPAGSGKTRTTLGLATALSELLDLGPVWMIDSENRSSKKYAYSPTTRKGFQFKGVFLPPDDYSPEMYMDALAHCEGQGARIVIIDSLSHAWSGANGVLEQVDRVTAASRSKSSFSEGWRRMTPIQNKLIQRILRSPAHVLLTLRTKVDWVLEDNAQGKKTPVKVGLAPIQREGVDYEPDLMFDLSVPENRAVVGKTRCDRIGTGEVFEKPGRELALRLAEWVKDTDLPRTLDEALAQAVEKGTAAWAQGEAGRPAYAAAREELSSWCRATGVATGAPLDAVLLRFKQAVTIQLRRTEAPPDGPEAAAPVLRGVA